MAKKRDHVPALRGRRLRQALAAVGKMPLNQRAKAGIQRILLEAADPDRHAFDHAAGRRHGANMTATQAAMTGLSRAHIRRIALRIAGDLPDDAWMDQIEEELPGGGDE